VSRGHPALAAGAVLLAVGAVLVAGAQHPLPIQETAQPQRRPISAATLSCPGARGTPAPPTTVFAVGRPGPAPGSGPDSGPGSVTMVTSAAQHTTLGFSDVPGRPLRMRTLDPAATDGVVVEGVGASAPGLAAAQFSTYTAPRVTGLAAAWCLAPRTSWWFNGIDTSVGSNTVLTLANPGPAAAVVDLDLLGIQGRVDAAGSSGIVIPPRSRRVLDLARYAPGQPALTLQIVATRGSVAAAASTTRVDGLTPVGAEWVPPSAPPARNVVVNATLGVAGPRSLAITNPGSRQQVVSIGILDASGAFTPTELSQVQVPPESTVITGVRAILGSRPTAIQLRAGDPVSGSLVSGRADRPVDFALSGTSEALTTPAVVPLLGGATITLGFAASSPGPREVEVTALSSRGLVVGRRTLTVNGSATTSWQPPDWPASYLVVTVPARSGLHGVVGYTSAAGVTQLPLLSSPLTLIRPGVLPF